MTIFAASPALLALNDRDPAVRQERIAALASLIEDFQIELAFDDDRFTGLRDAPAPGRDGGRITQKGDRRRPGKVDGEQKRKSTIMYAERTVRGLGRGSISTRDFARPLVVSPLVLLPLIGSLQGASLEPVQLVCWSAWRRR
jgi:hypothetical protein